MESRTRRSFWDCYAHLPEEVRAAARHAYQLFAANPQHPGLHFHRLKWNPRYWAVRVTRDYRAVGIVDGNVITWVWIGSHADYDKTFPT